MVLAENNCQEFWQLWEAHADYFYNCCLKWMGGNFNDTEEALSQATFTIQIVRVLPAGSLNNFQLNYYYNPTYKVAYSNNQDLWNAPSQVIVQ